MKNEIMSIMSGWEELSIHNTIYYIIHSKFLLLLCVKRCFGQFFLPTLKIQFTFCVIIKLISYNSGNNNIQKSRTHTLDLNLLVYCSIRRSIFKRLFTPIPHPFMSSDLNIVYFSFSLYIILEIQCLSFSSF